MLNSVDYHPRREVDDLVCKKKKNRVTGFYYIVPSSMAPTVSPVAGITPGYRVDEEGTQYVEDTRQFVPPGLQGPLGWLGGLFGVPQQGAYPGAFPGAPGYAPGYAPAPTQGGAPLTPPPAFTPNIATAVKVGTPGPGGGFQALVSAPSIRPCLYRFTYIWLNNRNSFWFYPIYLDQTTVAGFRWYPRRGWVYFGIDLRRIDAFQCF